MNMNFLTQVEIKLLIKLYEQARKKYFECSDIVSFTNRLQCISDCKATCLHFQGIFEKSGYWDVIGEYAKGNDRDILCSYTVKNRGEEAASIHILPTLWFRYNY